MANDLIKFSTDTGEVALSPSIVRNFITQNPKTTDAEVEMFIALCKYRKLNPFLREAFLVKYGDAPAQQIVAAVAMNKIAKANPNYKGEKSGVTVINRNNEIEHRRGTLVLSGEELIGAWCEVYVNGYVEPIFSEVNMSEYSKNQSTWKTMPAVMLHKVACATAWRSAFPNDFAGVYTAEEMPVDVSKLPTEPIEIKDVTEEPVYITDAQYHAMCKLFGKDAEKQKKAVAVFNKYGIPSKHPKFDKAYRAITTGRVYDEVMSDLIEALTEKPVIEIEPVIEPEPVDDLPGSYEPEISVVKESFTTEQGTFNHPNADFVPYGGSHKYAGQTLDEIPHWFLRKVIETEVAKDKYYDRNITTQNKVKEYMASVDKNENGDVPFDL